MGRDIPKRRKYKKDFLTSVVVRVDFDTDLPIATKGPSENIYSSVKDRFPITEERKIIGKKLLIGKDSTQESSVEKKEWRYFGKNREKYLTISPSYIFIEYKKYEYYEMLKEDFLSILNAVYETHPKTQINRFGLRYIDNIELDEKKPTDWSNYLKPELNAIFNLADARETIARAFHILEFNYGEYLLRFQFGMFNPDYPAPIKKKVYTLDCDVYTTNLLDKSDIEQTLEKFHTKISNSFEEVITDNLRQIMGPLNG